MYTLYIHPRCSTCKKAMKWLADQNIEYKKVDLLETPPTAEQFSEWMTASELPVRRFFNTSGMKYRELGLKDKVNDFSIKTAADMLSKDGMLIKRPILINEIQKLKALGFKESTYEEIFNS